MRHQEMFADITSAIGADAITVATLLGAEQAFNAARASEAARVRDELTPLTHDLIDAMNIYLRQFPEERADPGRQG